MSDTVENPEVPLDTLHESYRDENSTKWNMAPDYEAGGFLLQVTETHAMQHFVLMILPQVHLRKPCYDFYFL
jgi:hypothetical protein